MAEASFNWEDPLLLDSQLTDEERMIRDAARSYCQDKLAPRVLEVFVTRKLTSRFFLKWVNSVSWAPPFLSNMVALD